MIKKILKKDISIYIFFVLLSSTIYILIYNLFHYSPILGYDADAHYSYVDFIARYLPREFKLPTNIDTYEFFSPPMAYLFPASVQVICRNLIESDNLLLSCQPIYGKISQIFQSILYVITIYINLLSLKKIKNEKILFNTSYLILISLAAVNYRTISMIRGEPYLLFFMSLYIYILIKLEKENYAYRTRMIFFTGLVIAGIALSRQWGFLLFIPIIILTIKDVVKKRRIIVFKFWLKSSLIGFLLSGWFYFNLYFKYGTFTPFNLNSSKFSLNNQKLNFFIPSLNDITYLFTNPIRPFLNNQFTTILYADLWGDYWGYFTFTSKYLNIGRDQSEIGSYLARVNIVSVFTTSLIIFMSYLAYKRYKKFDIIQFIQLAIIVSFIGYLIFTIIYPTTSGDTIKSSYIIQLFNLVIFLASVYFHDLKRENMIVYNTLLIFLLIIYVHNFNSYLSHFPLYFYP